MATYSMTTLAGAQTTVDGPSTESLATRFKDRLVTPESSDYDEARTLWNAMIDRRPALVLRCANADDVVQAVNFAREHKLLTSVKSAGHNIAGNAVCDGGLTIDLSLMKSVKVDPKARTARVEPGVTLGELDAATQKHGLAVPVGINSTTGIAGLTLGGGFGWIGRTHGMTIDNLLGADIVTAAGKKVHASADSEPELFWGIRGGGGNFGIATAFDFRLHPIGPEVFAGLIVHPFSEAKTLLHQYRDLAAKAPDELTVWVVLRKAPPLPALPEEWHGKEVMVLAMLHTGTVAQGEAAAKPFRALGKPIADLTGPHPFTGFQSAFDPLLTPGVRNYWKSHNFKTLDDELIDVLLDYVKKLPTGHSEIFIGQMGGAQSRVAPDATAYLHRDAAFVMNVHTRWEDAADDQRCIAWARGLFNDTRPYATGGVYVNFMPDDEGDRIEGAYGANYQKLVTLKRKYDPDNLFRLNQNIRP